MDCSSNISNCYCSLVDGATIPHLHIFEKGAQGYMGDVGFPKGQFQYYNQNLIRNTKIKHIVYNDDTHCVISRGPQGPRGFNGGQYHNNSIFEPQKFIVIENCKWCDINIKHNHVVMEGNIGENGQ
jgi:hypothetical protein